MAPPCALPCQETLTERAIDIVAPAVQRAPNHPRQAATGTSYEHGRCGGGLVLERAKAADLLNNTRNLGPILSFCRMEKTLPGPARTLCNGNRMAMPAPLDGGNSLIEIANDHDPSFRLSRQDLYRRSERRKVS